MSQSSPFKDRYSNNSYSNNNSVSRNLSSEKKSTNSFYGVNGKQSNLNDQKEVDRTAISSVKNSVIEGK